MNTIPDPKTHCFLCETEMYITDAQNFQGHYAHGSCIAKYNACRAAGVTPEPYRPVPRREEPKVNPGSIIADAGAGGSPTPSHTPPVEEPLLPSLVIGKDMNPATEFDPVTKAMVAFIFPKELVEDGPNAVDILREMQLVAELLLTKNRAYGSSVFSGLNVFSKLSPVEAINARMDDKLARIKQAKDFTEDTEADLIGYLVLKRIALKLWAKGLVLQGQLGRVAFCDPAFGSKDKAVMATGIYKEGSITELQTKYFQSRAEFETELQKLGGLAKKTTMPTPEEMMALAAKPFRPTVEEVRQEDVQLFYYGCPCGVSNQWGVPCPQCGMVFMSRAQWLAITKAGYKQAYPKEPCVMGLEGWVPVPAAPAAGSSPPADSSTVADHAASPPVCPAPPADVNDGL